MNDTIQEVTPVINPTNKTDKPKPNSFIIMLLSVLLLISVLIAGFFAWQTQNLVKDVTKLRLAAVVTPVATVLPTDPTSDWKTYIDKKYGFQIKYPLTVEPTKENSQTYENYQDFINFKDTSNDLGLYSIGINTSTVEEEVSYIRAKTEGHIIADLTKNYKTSIAGFDATVLEYTKTDDKSEFNAITHTFFSNGKNTYEINIPSNLYEQVISTFKFIEASASSSPLPVACTMDAKICPDGSAVGRSGPKCEFAACPTSPQP